MYLSSYKLNLISIEEMWSKVKAFLRKKKARSFEMFDEVLPEAFALVFG